MNKSDELRQIALRTLELDDERDAGLALLRLYATLKFLEIGKMPNPGLVEYEFLVKDVFEGRKVLSDSDAKLITSVNIYDLIRFCLYDVISDYDAVMRFDAAYPMEYWRLLSEIFIAYDINSRIDSGKYLNESSRIKIYHSMAHDKEIMLDDSKFRELYAGVNSYTLTRDCFRFPSKMKDAIDTLISAGIDDRNLLEIICSVYSPAPDGNRINEILDICEIAASDRRKLIQNIASGSDGVITPFSVWKYRETNDVPVENTLLYNLFYSRMGMSVSHNALVFFPSSFFMKKIFMDEYARSINTTFVFRNETIASAYENSFHTKAFRFVTFKSLKKEISTAELGYDQILVFGNLSRSSRNDIFQKMAEQLRHSVRLVLMAGSDEFENGGSEISRLLQSTIMAEHFIILPKGIQNATEPKRKLILDGYIGGTHSITESRITYMKLDKTGREQRLSPHYILDRIDIAELQKKGKTLRDLYRQHLNKEYKKTDSVRNRAESYRFSDEIIFYAASRETNTGYRIEAYAYPPDYEKQVKLGIETDDNENIEQVNVNKRIEGSVKRTTKAEYTEQDKKRWVLEEYPYANIRERRSATDKTEAEKPIRTVRDAIIDSYKDTLGKAITIKTYVYFRPELEEKLTPEEIRLLRHLTSSEIGWQRFPVNDDYIRTIFNEMYAAISEEKAKEEIAARRILKLIFAHAVGEGYTPINPFNDESVGQSKERSGDLLFTQVRKSALIKRYFEIREMLGIYKKCITELKHRKYIYLGILIKLFLGLESNVVSGLIWDDFVELEEAKPADEKIYQLLIRRQAVNDGSGYRPFSRKESYRILCLPDILADILKKEYDRLLSIFPAAQLKDKPIVDAADGNDITRAICSPIRLQKTCRSIVRGLHLDENIISVPTNNDGTKETNINDYQGDIFRSNYEHYARISARFNAGELAYMLGTKTEITFSNNYCDYGNPISQIILYRKQCRWNALFLKENDAGTVRLQDDGTGSMYLESSGYIHSPVMLSGSIEYEGPDLQINISSDYGFDLMIGSME